MRLFARAALVVLALAAIALPSNAQVPDDPCKPDPETDKPPPWRYDRALIYCGENSGIKIQNRAQVRFTLTDPEVGSGTGSFDIARHKLSFTGKFRTDWKFNVQANFTETDKAFSALEDAYFVFTRRPLAQLWVGQGKTFFGRQELISSANLQFVDRSIASWEFRHRDGGEDSRDVGVALIGQNRAKTYEYAIGVYNGNGINKDEKDNADYMAAVRLVITPFGEYALSEVDLERPATSKLAVGVSVRTLTQGTEAINEKTRDSAAALEVAYKIHGLNLSAEFFTRSEEVPFDRPGEEEDTDGWYLQGGWQFRRRPIEVTARYSEVLREALFKDETEMALGVNYYFPDHRSKVQFDYRRLEFERVPNLDPPPPQISPKTDRDEFRFQLQMMF